MYNYCGNYRSKDGKAWAWREAIYANDVIALSQMRVLSLKKTTLVDGEAKERMVHYDLDYLKNGNRVVYNG